MYHVVQMGWDGQVGLPGLRGTVWYVPWDPSVPHGTDGMGWKSGTTWLNSVLYGTSHGIPVYHMVQMGWDGQVGLPGLRGTAWYVPWDPSVPHGTDGMGWTSGTTWLNSVLYGTSHGIPVYHMVQIGQVRLPGLRGTVWYVPWDPSVPRGTDGMGWTSGTT